MKYLLGESSADEQLAVESWLKEDAANQQQYDQLKKIWENSKQLAAESDADENMAWEKFRKKISAETQPAVTKPAGKKFSFLKIAALFVLVAGLAIITYLMRSGNNDTAEQIATAGETVLTDTLPDGSVVTLNKQSSLIYPGKFKGETRTVTLKGEAFFHVTPDKKKPFIISVNNIQVTVVGTSFNIKSNISGTEVIVETGVVRVARNGKTIELRAGEKLMFSAADSIPVKETVTDQLYNYYRSREFVCDDTPLWKLVDVLNEAYGSQIVIGRKELRELRITTTFNNESLDKILEVIHLTFDISISRQDGQVILN